MSEPRNEPSLPFLARWTLLTVLGYAAGFFVGFFAGNFLLGNVMIGVFTGGTVGYAQYVAHRRITEKPGLWVLAGMIVLFPILFIYGVVADVLDYPFDLGWPHGVVGWAVALFFGGAAIGLVQSHLIALRRSTTIWWVITCGVGWSASALGLAVPIEVQRDAGVALRLVEFLGAPLVAGLILGLITGISIVWHRKTRRPA